MLYTLRLFSIALLVVTPAMMLGSCNTSSSDESASTGGSGNARSYQIVDTGQSGCYDNSAPTACPSEGSTFYGQDAQYGSPAPSYTDNGDGTVTDNVTGLMWQKDPGGKVTFNEANQNASSFALGGYNDWRVPNIKELYSLINFNGVSGQSADSSTPFIDTTYFAFVYGDESAGERFIDAQYRSSTEYVSTTMNGDATVFGVNFADGRIKGYPRDPSTTGNQGMMFLLYVRGGNGYGVNNFTDNGDGTVTDLNSGLMWQKSDDGTTRNWADALAYCENLGDAGYSDWRLPNAKELQGLVDYTRSPDTTGSAAIDPVFNASSFIDGNGFTNFGYYWTNTTHLNGAQVGEWAVYIAFGEALGYMPDPRGGVTLMDVHGAGAQRSDPKSGDPSQYPVGFGPQGDDIRIFNYARCVR